MRKHIRERIHIGLMGGMILLMINACHEDAIFNPLRDEEAPILQLINPDTSTLIAFRGETVDFSFEAADDKGLTSFSVSYHVSDPNGTELLPLTLLDQSELSSTFEQVDFSTTIDSFPSFSTITYTFSVEDQTGKSDQLEVVITALQQEESAIVRFPTSTYTSRRLWSGASDSLSGYNFSTQQFYPAAWTNPLSVDITETSSGDTFLSQLSSPNNDRLQKDSVFVHLSPSQINFEEADYSTIWGFYHSASLYYQKSPPLVEGDLLIIRLTKAPFPQFALMRILTIQDLPGVDQDYLAFDYKVTSE